MAEHDGTAEPGAFEHLSGLKGLLSRWMICKNGNLEPLEQERISSDVY